MIGLVMALAAGAAPDLGWRNYVNAKYAYATCYPSRLFRARPESDAGDGRTFTAADGAELRVWGEYANDTNFASEAASVERDLAGRRGVVTYKVARAGWTVISGTSGPDIFWAKIAQRGDRFMIAELTHPTSLKPRYAAVPAILNRCSSLGTSAD